ncbi:putative DoxX family protein [Actinacidiphila reveromycinica]|uniref:Putative DoxX family protein n=1 Tax=Actinacidiphila reveromycinica TaxID=659352 RepID=A0A7U3UUL0_9ACTN|nr:DoxX family protein [Streptomyces sp. SN-593]BBA98941.1 putative DoxX family protein [Streptomyces sp. SN-593]
MSVFLWVVQTALAAAFALSGLVKATEPRERLVGRFPWAEDFSLPALRFIGAMGLLGAVGLVAPGASGVLPVLTPVAATGLAVMMALAGATHVRRGEPSGVVVAAVLLLLAALVAWGRFGPYGW